MERRHFIGGCAAALPLYGAVATAQETATPAEKPKKTRCRITVVKRSAHQDLADARRGLVKPCDAFKDGQEFSLTGPWSPPEGFCAWAWADIRSQVMANFHGGEFPTVACCTDGYRPVHFRIERIEQKA